MKYEFHVGDYVETSGGAFGYISNDKELWWRCTNKADGYEEGFEYNIWAIEAGAYKRIGQYNFTKPEQPKEIERLSDNWLMSDLVKKINTLVDAVNELRKERT